MSPRRNAGGRCALAGEAGRAGCPGAAQPLLAPFWLPVERGSPGTAAPLVFGPVARPRPAEPEPPLRPDLEPLAGAAPAGAAPATVSAPAAAPPTPALARRRS